jgi:hypothetical protein
VWLQVPLDAVDLSHVSILYTQGEMAAITPIYDYNFQVPLLLLTASVCLLRSTLGALQEVVSHGLVTCGVKRAWLGEPQALLSGPKRANLAADI